LATEALTKKENAMATATRAAKDLVNQEKMVAQLEGNVTRLKSQLSKWENELTTLKARAKVASATKSLNKQLANADSDGTIAMLEKMKSKVDEDEALAESYGEIAAVETSVDTEIDNILGGETSTPASDSLAEMKKKMGIN
jgi:phage shock protein A